MTDPKLYAVLMAGGSGTRFWPASRERRPKQYLPITGGTPMLAGTADRLEGLVPPERVLVVTAAGQEDEVRRCLPWLPRENLMVEPAARNTAPCVAFAALEVERRDPSAVQVVLPADHLIEPRAAFQATLRAAAREAAESGALVTLGIRPDHPATGYGYIETAEELARRGEIPVLRVARFVEKPDLERARAFLAQGGFLWNAGIFVWSSAAIRAALERFLPEVVRGLEQVAAGGSLAEIYPTFPSQPVDVAVLEKADHVRVLPVDYTWSDVGSWAALADIAPEVAGHVRAALAGGAEVIAEDSKDCLVYAEGEELVALLGVRDLVVVRAGNATLVCPRERAQDVRRIVEELRRRADGRYL